MPKIFSPLTLGQFADASASIPLRQLDRAFTGAGIRLGEDADETGGSRRIQFRRYIASIDQKNPKHLDRLGDALGALIAEVATSKQDYLVKAAERDGFAFAGGVFRPAVTAPYSFGVKSAEDLAAIDDRARRLHLLANDSPQVAIGGAMGLAESVCRTVLRLRAKPSPAKTAGLVEIAKKALAALEEDPKLVCVVASLDELRNESGSRYARLAAGAAVSFAEFVAETYLEQAGSNKP